MTHLRRSDHLRVLVALIADEIGRAQSRAVDPSEFLRWDESTKLDESGVGADSLVKLDLVERVNEFYNLHEIGSEDYLVIAPTLGEWIDVIEETLRRGVRCVSLRTSGSTSEPKLIDIPWAELHQELDAFDAVLGDARRVLAWTPPHHLYGFLFAALYPARRDIPLIDGRGLAPSALRRCGPGDLVVATPFLWRRLLAPVRLAAPDGVLGLCSGAPCEAEIWRGFAHSDARLVEIYGSTETGGLGWRDDGAAAFQMLGHWRREATDSDGDALRRDGRAAPEPAPDHLVFDSDGRFRPAGRRDHVVQVGGVNVSPALTVEALEAHPLVAEAAVRVDESHPDKRLKAFIVPLGSLPPDALERIESDLRARLAAPARPASLTAGPRLPRNAMGKLADWAVAPAPT